MAGTRERRPTPSERPQLWPRALFRPDPDTSFGTAPGPEWRPCAHENANGACCLNFPSVSSASAASARPIHRVIRSLPLRQPGQATKPRRFRPFGRTGAAAASERAARILCMSGTGYAVSRQRRHGSPRHFTRLASLGSASTAHSKQQYGRRDVAVPFPTLPRAKPQQSPSRRPPARHAPSPSAKPEAVDERPAHAEVLGPAARCREGPRPTLRERRRGKPRAQSGLR